MIVACLSFVATQPAISARPTSYLREFDTARAVIETSRLACIVLDIYLADTGRQHSQGLMFIEQLDEHEGMLFRYPRDAILRMWMKNTYIPLDMLFIRGDGEIAGIARNTTPMSTKTIESPEPVRFVLELNGGMTERWQIQAGNRLLAIN